MRLTTKEVSNGLTLYNLKSVEGEDAIVQQLSYYGAVKKLGQHEDIEEESGIYLVTLFKAQTEGIWELAFDGYDKEGKPTYKPRKVARDFYIDFRQKALVGSWIGFEFKDYGKKKVGGWALTKEELE